MVPPVVQTVRAREPTVKARQRSVVVAVLAGGAIVRQLLAQRLVKRAKAPFSPPMRPMPVKLVSRPTRIQREGNNPNRPRAPRANVVKGNAVKDKHKLKHRVRRQTSLRRLKQRQLPERPHNTKIALGLVTHVQLPSQMARAIPKKARLHRRENAAGVVAVVEGPRSQLRKVQSM